MPPEPWTTLGPYPVIRAPRHLQPEVDNVQ